VFDDGHVLGPAAGSQACEVVVEDDIEDLVQPVLDAPVGAHGGGKGPGIELCGGDVVALLVSHPGVVGGRGLDHGDGGEAGEYPFVGVAAVGHQPSDVMGDAVAALLDAAMVAVAVS